MMKGDDDVDNHGTPFLGSSIVGSYNRTINGVVIDLTFVPGNVCQLLHCTVVTHLLFCRYNRKVTT